MKKMNTAPISGMQELLPQAQVTFNQLKSKIAEVYRSHGFLNIETPTIERREILTAKAGGDTEKQIYNVYKTAETADESDQALRFDHTVPLARYVVEHENDLAFPFKVSQIGRNFRGERAQRGRFREFYQCDVDVIGRTTLPLFYDADVISTLLSTFASFELKTPVLARLNNRKIVSGLLEKLDLVDKSELIYSLIDHCEKVSPEETRFDLEEAGIEREKIAKLLAFMDIHGPREEVIPKLFELANSFGGLNADPDQFATGLSELDEVMQLLEADGLKDQIIADMRIVRGLDYYTGTVFEFILPEYKKVGSVCGGGRYENLAGNFTDAKLPGVGGSIGLTRLFFVLNENHLAEKSTEKPVDVAVIPIEDAQLPFALKVARELRAEGNVVTVVVLNKRLGEKLGYAAKFAKKVAILGEDEAASENYELREIN